MADTKSRRKQKNDEIAVQEARQDFKALLNRVEFGGERIVIKRYNQPSAALVSIADLAKLEGAA